MIPLYIIEEHHEAFYIWNKAAQAGFLPPFGNTLLHVDHHPDFECGSYGTDLDAPLSTLEEIRAFTYTCLGIADFICPAIYRGIFNEIVILKDFSPILSKPEDRLVRLDADGSLSVDGLTLLTRLALLKPEATHKLFTYRQGGLGNFSTPQTLALDIDLDYFCHDDSLSSITHKRLEITEQTYRELTENPYHPFRLLPKAWLRPVEEGGRYYFCYEGLPKPPPLPDDERIRRRIDLLIHWLGQNGIAPGIISICRSRYSGYTPTSKWEVIENELLRRLGEVYDYDMQG